MSLPGYVNIYNGSFDWKSAPISRWESFVLSKSTSTKDVTIINELTQAVETGNIALIQELSSHYNELSASAKSWFRERLIWGPEEPTPSDKYDRCCQLKIKVATGNLEFVSFTISLGKQLDSNFIANNLFCISMALNEAIISGEFEIAKYLIKNCPGVANNQGLYIAESNRFKWRYDPRTADKYTEIITLLNKRSFNHYSYFEIDGSGRFFEAKANMLEQEYQEFCKACWSKYEVEYLPNGSWIIKPKKEAE